MGVLNTHVIEEIVDILPMNTSAFAGEDTQKETVIKVKRLPFVANFKV